MKTNEEKSMLFSVQRKLFLRKLLEELEGIQYEETNTRTAVKIQNVFDKLNSVKSDENSEKINSDEVLLNLSVVTLAGNAIIKCLKNINVLKTTYDPIDFAARITANTNDEGSDKSSGLLTLLKDARTIIRDIPQLTYITGSYISNATVIRKFTKRTKENESAKVKLSQIQDVEHEEENVNETVNLLYKKLLEKYISNNKVPINFYKYVLDRTSYSLTVQNIFYSSFLVRDAKACIDCIENCITIKPIKKRQFEEFQENNHVNSQIMFSITKDDWQQMCLNN